MSDEWTTPYPAPASVPTIEFNDTGNWNTMEYILKGAVGVDYVFDNEINSGLDGGMFIFVFVFCACTT